MKAIISTVALGAAFVLAAAVPGGAQTGGSMGHAMMMVRCPGGYVLNAIGGSGESGCATPRGGNGVIFLAIKVSGEPPGANQPSHVHRGRCGSNGPITIPLTNVRGGTSVTNIPNAKWSTVNHGGFYINIHESAKNLKHIVSCANITPMHGAM
jgi:CHRD domain